MFLYNIVQGEYTKATYTSIEILSRSANVRLDRVKILMTHYD